MRGALNRVYDPKRKAPQRVSLSSMMSLSEASDDGDDGQGASFYATIRHKVDFLSEMILGMDLLVVFLASSTLTLLVNSGGESEWMEYLSQSKPSIATLGALYSFALVFRTNICYSRWWEGRTLWGTIIVDSIRIVQQARVSFRRSEQFNEPTKTEHQYVVHYVMTGDPNGSFLLSYRIAMD